MSNFKLLKAKEKFETFKKYKKYSIDNVKEPNLYRDIFSYSEVPRDVFDGVNIDLDLPEDFWITCTTFRDGQQARPPYTVKEIVDLYKMMHKLGGPNGVIRQCEFFLYSDKDKEAVRKCLELGYEFPEVTGWIRAKAEDFKLVKEMGLKETGILTSISDYHIYLKLGLDRKQAVEKYIALVKSALDAGVKPRCHFEDLTRADFYGVVIPYAQQLMDLSKEAKVPIKIRLCDTMGYGLPFAESALPRGVPKIIQTLKKEAGVPSELLEWHGHNDFHKAHICGMAAWLYGCSSMNGTLLGFGERCGNPPIEGACIEYASLKGSANGMDLSVITDIADYFQNEIGTKIAENYPFAGESFNVTRAGIHADGVIKNQEIYNIFDTEKILKRPLGITITDKSGLAGIALWINTNLKLKGKDQVSKTDDTVQKVNDWVLEQYTTGRTTGISPAEMMTQLKIYFPKLVKSEFDLIKDRVRDTALDLIKKIAKEKDIVSMDHLKQEKYLKEFIEDYPFIQLLYVTDAKGNKITKNITKASDANKYKRLGVKFSDREWFKIPMKTGKPHITDLYTSQVTGLLCVTVSASIKDSKGKNIGIVGLDIKFEDLSRR